MRPSTRAAVSNRRGDRAPIVRAALALALGLALAAPLTLAAQALTPAFTWQGELRLASGPATGPFDMEFRLFNAISAGTQIGVTVTAANVPVTGGLFAVPLDFGAAQFAGDRQWLQVRIRPGGTMDTFETLAPRTEVTAAPYAWGARVALADSVTTTSIVDGTLGAIDINATQVQRRVTGNCPTGQYVRVLNQDGSVTCGTDATGTGTVTSVATGAGLTGGPITATGTISIAAGGVGTTEINATQVQRRVAGICPAGQYLQSVTQDGSVTCGTDAIGTPGWGLTGNAGTNPATQFIGTTDNQPFVVRTANARSLRIEPSSITFGTPALPVTTNTIGGSHANAVTAGVRGATIGGGGVPAGESDPDLGLEAPNRITDHFGTVGGGYANRAGNDDAILTNATFATVGGGSSNAASGDLSTVGGGQTNTASGVLSTLGGGFGNIASGDQSTVSGGFNNTANGALSTLGGGFGNSAGGSQSTLGGGFGNTASGERSTVGGGSSNTASGIRSAVGGGQTNSASGFAGTVSGGESNTASGSKSAVGGGVNNIGSGDFSTVGGGFTNTASGGASTVGGGESNCAGGEFSWAGGRRAKVRPATNPGGTGSCSGLTYPGIAGDLGSFVWADGQGLNFVSTGTNQFLVRAAGGIWLGTSGAVSIPAGRFINTSTGAHLTTGGAWTNASSRALKTGFAAVDPAEVLARVLALGISTWTYRASDMERHMGPVAEDFHALFGLGGDAVSISTVDASGVALAAIQGLDAKLEAERDALAARVSALDTENAALRTESAELRAGQERLASELAEIRALLRAGAAER